MQIMPAFKWIDLKGGEVGCCTALQDEVAFHVLGKKLPVFSSRLKDTCRHRPPLTLCF